MIRTIQFLLFVLAFSFTSQGQSCGMHTFYDYKKCLTGFVDGDGDTLYPAIFEQASSVAIGRKRATAVGWVVTQDKKVGLISEVGEILIPIQYERLYYIQDSVFVVHAEDMAGLYNLRTGRTIEPVYSSIRYKDNHEMYYVRKNGLMGVLDKHTNVLVEPKYDEIKYIFGKSQQEKFLDEIDYFKITVDGKMGLMHRDGRIVVGPIYEAIYREEVKSPCGIESVYFRALNEKSKFGILNYKGELEVPCEHNSVKVLYEFNEDCSAVTRRIAVTRTKKRYKAFDLLEKKESQEYLHLQVYQDGYIYTNKKGCGVLDNSFQPTLEFADGVIVPNFKKYSDINFEINRRSYIHQHSIDDSLTLRSHLVHLDANPLKWIRYNYHKKYNIERSYFQLNSQSKTGYHTNICSSIGTADTSIWAFDLNGANINDVEDNLSSKPVTITVYDQDFNPKFSRNILSAVNNYVIQLDYESCEFARRPVLLKDEDSKLGIVSNTGEILAPFEYDGYLRSFSIMKDEMYPNRYTNNEQFTVVDRYMVLSKEGKKTLYNSAGEQLLPCKYDWIHKNGYQIAAKAGDTTFYFSFKMDSIGMEVFDPNAEVISEENTTEEYQEVEYFEHGYFTKEGFLYYLSKDTVTYLVDSNYVAFNTHVVTIGGKYLITKKGKVLKVGRFRLAPYTNGYFVQENDRLTYFDNDHNELLNYENASISPVSGDNLILKLGKYKQGVYNTEQNKWIMEPKYVKIDPNRNKQRKLLGYWATESKKSLRRGNWTKGHDPIWQGYNIDGSLKFDHALNGKYYAYNNESHLVHCGQKKGALNNRMELVVPPIYDYVREVDSSYYMYNDGQWFIYSNGTISKESYDAISDDHYGAGFVVYREGKMSILDHDLNTLLPFTSYEEAIKIDLIQLLDLNEAKLTKNWASKVTSDLKANDSLVMNYQLWRMLYEGSTKDQFYGPKTFNSRRYKPKKAELFEYYNHISRFLFATILYSNGTYYSEKLVTYKSTNTTYRYRGTKYSWSTFKVSDGVVTKYTLRDLIVPGKEDALDTLMMEELNRVQAYGAKCVDLMGEVGDLKERFSLGQFGIEFHDVSRTVTSIVIPYYVLEGIIKLD